MKELVLFAAIMTSMLPIGYRVLKFIFKDSIILTISWLNLIIIYTVSLLYYIVGAFGLLHLIWAIPLAGAIAMIVFYVIRKKVQKPLINAIKQLNNIADGDLDISNVKDLNEQSGELGVLTGSIQKLAIILKHLVKDIRRSSRMLSKSSEQLTDNISQMANGSARQAASSQELSSTMDEIASMVGENAQNALSSRELSSVNMGKLKELFELSENISKAVSHISEKASVINEIAEHTNILALNAAVEAARAGQAGRGFSVVAKEVRTLAERSRGASDDINKLAYENQQLVLKTSFLFEEMLPDLEKSSGMVVEIAAASSEQKQGIEQINKALQELNQVTQLSASKSEQMEFTSRELKELADSLNDSLAFFNLKSGEKRSNKSKIKKVNQAEELKSVEIV